MRYSKREWVVTDENRCLFVCRPTLLRQVNSDESCSLCVVEPLSSRLKFQNMQVYKCWHEYGLRYGIAVVSLEVKRV